MAISSIDTVSPTAVSDGVKINIVDNRSQPMSPPIPEPPNNATLDAQLAALKDLKPIIAAPDVNTAGTNGMNQSPTGEQGIGVTAVPTDPVPLETPLVTSAQQGIDTAGIPSQAVGVAPLAGSVSADIPVAQPAADTVAFKTQLSSQTVEPVVPVGAPAAVVPTEGVAAVSGDQASLATPVEASSSGTSGIKTEVAADETKIHTESIPTGETTLTPEELQAIETKSAGLYAELMMQPDIQELVHELQQDYPEDKYEYHNWKHSTYALEKMVRLSVVEEMKFNKPTDPHTMKLRAIMVLFHDKGIQFGTKGHEIEGAALANDWMKVRGYSMDDRSDVISGILSSELQFIPGVKLVQPDTQHYDSRMMQTVDLYNFFEPNAIKSSEKVFMEQKKDLFEEERKSGQPLDVKKHPTEWTAFLKFTVQSLMIPQKDRLGRGQLIESLGLLHKGAIEKNIDEIVNAIKEFEPTYTLPSA